MITKDILLGPRLKAQRANRHIRELIAFTQPLHPSFFELVVEPQTISPNANPTRYYLSYRPKQPIPQTLALIIGDAVHNLRAALDHLASAIVRTNHPDAKPYFPVRKEREKLIEAGDLALMEAALPGSKRVLLDQIRPVNCGRDHLWQFGSLDIDDKHNLVIPTVTVADIRNINVTCGTGTIAFCTASNDAAKPFNLTRTDRPPTVHGDPETVVAVEFGEGTPFKGHPVVPTLLDIEKLVMETLIAFERLIEESGHA